MAERHPTIGLEIHAELATTTKMFCRSRNDPEEKRPNWNVCPVCMAHPGTLPTINHAAVRSVLRVGLAVGGQLADFTEFDRKNYFYPDIPKGYQISQYAHPLVSGGTLAGVALTRIHLEEDTARSIHDEATGSSLIDYNRAGVPLMELVTEPVITSGAQAAAFARELQLLLRYLGAGNANLEKGEMRIEANISLDLGTKVEIKNLNSFRSVERAIAVEIERQRALIDSGGTVVQETRGWNEDTGTTFSQRRKESSHDYRYFPEPDLPKLFLSRIPEFANLAATLPELPWAKRERYARDYHLKLEDLEAYVTDQRLGAFFEQIAVALGDPALVTLASNYIANDLVPHLGADPDCLARVAPGFPKLITLLAAGTISSRAGKDILAQLVASGGDPEQIAEREGLYQTNDATELGTIVDAVIAAHAGPVAEFRSGKTTVLQYLVGQAMKVSKGAGNPARFAELFKERLK